MLEYRSPRRALFAVVLTIGVALAACGDGDGGDKGLSAAPETTAKRAVTTLSAQVASYDLIAKRPQRVIVGLLTNEQDLIGYGTVQMAFAYMGTKEQPLQTPRAGTSVEGDFRAIPGKADPSSPPAAPTRMSGGAAGVYGTDGVVFDDAGVWEVRVSARVDDKPLVARAAFEVFADSTIPNVGDPAPRSQNLLAGLAAASPKAVDSRADDKGAIPDAPLHAITVADAIAARQPLMVVVSTPVYCVSRFCGPITDTVGDIATRSGDKMKFVHIEVWKNFEGKALAAAAADWIYPTKKEDIREPWVFVVGADGIITHRFDNVATTAELDRAVAEVTA